MSDEELIQKIINGDQNTLLHIMDTYSKLLWVVVAGALSGIGTSEDIEECISDVYVQVWKNPYSFDSDKGSLKTFLAIIAKSKAIDKYRKLSKSSAAPLDEAINSTDDDLLEYIINCEMHQELYEAIETLNEPNKEIVIRRYFFEEKVSKIAENISLPLKEVENRLYQSKLKLRKELEKKEGGVLWIRKA